MNGRLSYAIAILLALSPALARAQGGPPLLTDDPDTPGPGYWEINVAIESEDGGARTRVQVPDLDINYGAGTRIQLKFEIPWVAVDDASNGRGVGNANAGMKWRFRGSERERLAWSIYPQVEFHSSPASLDEIPGSAAPILHLPTELTVRIARLEVNGEIGRSIVTGGNDRWFGGVSTEVEARYGFEIVGEVHDDKSTDAPSDFIANVGLRPAITRQLGILFAVGRSLHSGHGVPPYVRIYAGLQFNLPGRYESSTPTR